MDLLRQVEAEATKDEIPDFQVGDTVRVHVRIREGDRERTQTFEGTVLRRGKSGVRQNFTVRRVSQNIGVERTFLLHSPLVDHVAVVRRPEGRQRQAKLYYLRKRIGKSARVRDRQR